MAKNPDAVNICQLFQKELGCLNEENGFLYLAGVFLFYFTVGSSLARLQK